MYATVSTAAPGVVVHGSMELPRTISLNQFFGARFVELSGEVARHVHRTAAYERLFFFASVFPDCFPLHMSESGLSANPVFSSIFYKRGGEEGEGGLVSGDMLRLHG